MRRLGLALKFAVTIGLLSYLFLKAGISNTLSQAIKADPWLLAAGLFTLSLQPLLGAFRWHLVLHSLRAPPPFPVSLNATYISVLFGQLLPATVGADGIRIWLLCRAGCPLRKSLNGVLLDRVIMLLCLIFMFTVDTPWLTSILKMHGLNVLALGMLGTAMCGILVLSISDRLPTTLQRYRVVRGLANLAQDTRALIGNPAYAFAVATLSLLSYINILAGLYLFIIAFGAAPLLLPFFIVAIPVLLVSAIPISIGSWGTRELAAVAAFATVGVSANAALNASIALGVASILIALPGFFFYWFSSTSTDNTIFSSPHLSPTDGTT